VERQSWFIGSVGHADGAGAVFDSEKYMAETGIEDIIRGDDSMVGLLPIDSIVIFI
jgi:hypothetical protein